MCKVSDKSTMAVSGFGFIGVDPVLIVVIALSVLVSGLVLLRPKRCDDASNECLVESHLPCALHEMFNDVLISRLRQKIRQIVLRELKLKHDIGVAVSVFFKGVEIVCVTGGSVRTKRSPKEWVPVTPETKFCPFSVSKGVAAVALMTLVDRKLISYTRSISKFWKGFPGNGSFTVEDAVSHRCGLTHFPYWLVPAVVSGSFNGALGVDVSVWRKGIDWISSLKPRWNTPNRASYHAVSFSWIIGGIIYYGTGLHIADVVRENVAAVLGAKDEMYLGSVPPSVIYDVALFEKQHSISYQRKTEGLAVCFIYKVFARIESTLLRAFSRLQGFLRICLPSSNGVYTARSLGRMYGALANGGKVVINGELRQLVGKKTLNDVCSKIEDEAKRLGIDSDKARLSCGFSPWAEDGCLAHGGMGGSYAMCNFRKHFSCVVLRTAYTPSLTNNEKYCKLVEDILKEVDSAL